ncbi:hypothetical protein [Streptomyces sp. NBC_01264]|uniref:hypothetical protein n=1 Tax=Streptomyces sp. NBC_01264 TaxID=2903804 RepID=UPI0022540B79|nr:hypothetical protein [Streptomyces sp. NBC_01264]MCX4781229.1 hypothetical protein [Streptomyces sp. NBC_01264]
MDTTKTPAPTAPEADSPADLKKAATDGTTAPAAADTTTTDEALDLNEGTEEAEEFDGLDAEADEEQSSGVASGASAIVAAGLGLIALSGSWTSRVMGERETLKGQISSADASSTADKIEALYGNAWHMTALVNGVLSTIALLLAVFVLARPAFGAPGRTLPAWVRSVSWAAVVVAVIGIAAFLAMYLLALPTAPAA